MLPVLQGAFEGVINQRIEFVRIRFDEVEVDDALLDRCHISPPLSLWVLAMQFHFTLFHVLECLLEVILPCEPVVALLLDELQGSEAQSSILVGLSEQTDWLTSRAQPADSFVVGDVV